MIKWLRAHYRNAKAVYYKKEILTVRINDNIPHNYSIAKKIFEGCFSYATYECAELMICYRFADKPFNKSEFLKISNAIKPLGFNLVVSEKCDNADMLVIGMVPEQNLSRYITDKAMGLTQTNIESLYYLAD